MKTNEITADMLTINDELKNLLRPLTESERKALTLSIKRDGVLDAIKCWQNPENEQYEIADGHNRFEIANKLNEPFELQLLDLKTLDEVKYWMYRNQSARRDGKVDGYAMHECLVRIKLAKGEDVSKYQIVQQIAKDTNTKPETIKKQVNRGKQQTKPPDTLKTPKDKAIETLGKLDRETLIELFNWLREQIEKPSD